MRAAMSGMITRSSPERGTSWRRAMITPPIVRIGAEIMTLRAIRTSVWTCCTSFVLRVIRLAAPNLLTSTWLYVSTLRKMAVRTSRPKPIEIRAAQ